MLQLLVIDNQLNTSMEMKKLLCHPNLNILTIETAFSYQEGLKKAIQLHPHIVFAEAKINGESGVDQLCRLKEIDTGIPFIILSYYYDYETVREGFLAGASDFIKKPLQEADMQSAIEHIVISNPDYTDQVSLNETILQIPNKNLSSMVIKILNIIHSEYDKNLELLQISQRFDRNSKYLGRLFLQETNMKFSDYLLAYRMFQAKKRIELTNEKISVIAQKCGYSYLNTFYTHFRGFFNQSPTEVRNKSEI